MSEPHRSGAATVSRATDIHYLQAAMAVAERAVAKGSHPFGAVLVDAAGAIVLEGENTSLRDGGPGHAESNLARRAAREFPAAFLEHCTLYTSVEPCCMCAGTIYWAQIGAVVFGWSERALLEVTAGHAGNPTLDLPCARVFGAGQRKVEVRGPFEELTAPIAAVHRAFWSARDGT
jgi:tRNA(Arg) A34 adenosine deaminase TadA